MILIHSLDSLPVYVLCHCAKVKPYRQLRPPALEGYHLCSLMARTPVLWYFDLPLYKSTVYKRFLLFFEQRSQLLCLWYCLYKLYIPYGVNPSKLRLLSGSQSRNHNQDRDNFYKQDH